MMKPPLDREQIFALADEHTRAVQAWLASRTPQGKRLELSGVVASSTGLHVQFLNLALSRPYPYHASAETIEEEIETVKSFYGQQGVPWYWVVGPRQEPADIGKQLERHGLAYEPPDLPAMVACLPAVRVPIDPAINVRRASNTDDLKAASYIRRTSFEFAEGAADHYFEDMPDDWLDNKNVRLYLASIGENPPAAIGALILGAGAPGVYVMATLPEWERRGLGRAILSHLLSDAWEMRHQHTILTASSKGFPLYRKFGFEHVFDYKFFASNAPGHA
ncbi:MAG: GNAT family N-acetyltransferase [Chloroflexota bacterium]